MSYIIIHDNKIIDEFETYEEACDKALMIETIYNTIVRIKEKNERINKKYGNAKSML